MTNNAAPPTRPGGATAREKILVSLADLNEATARDLATHAGIGYSTASPHLRALHELGHVQQREALGKVLWKLTDSGRAAAPRDPAAAPLPPAGGPAVTEPPPAVMGEPTESPTVGDVGAQNPAAEEPATQAGPSLAAVTQTSPPVVGAPATSAPPDQTTQDGSGSAEEPTLGPEPPDALTDELADSRTGGAHGGPPGDAGCADQPPGRDRGEDVDAGGEHEPEAVPADPPTRPALTPSGRRGSVPPPAGQPKEEAAPEASTDTGGAVGADAPTGRPKRRGKGVLEAEVFAVLGTHPNVDLTVGETARLVDEAASQAGLNYAKASPGAVVLALQRLVIAGRAAQTKESRGATWRLVPGAK